MGRIEKTVFISYRRTNFYTALAVYQYLTQNGYDAFFDYQSIDAGDFSKAILENIAARAHFVLVLSSSALERCSEPNDWLRREIETAMELKRNIVPLMMEGFDFGSPTTIQALSGKLATLNTYNGLRLYSEYFFDAMEKLRTRFLNVALDDVRSPEISTATKEANEIKKTLADEAPQVEIPQITAEEWFERAYALQETKNYDEAIRCYTEALRLEPDLFAAHNNLGNTLNYLKRYDEAEAAYRKAIEINPSFDSFYINLGQLYLEQGKEQEAIYVLTEAIRINPESARCFRQRGLIYQTNGNLESALEDYRKAIELQADYGIVRMSLFGLLKKMGKDEEAREHESLAREFAKTESEYNRACFEALCKNADEAINLLKIALEKGQSSKDWAQQDPDFENIRNNPRFKELVSK